MANKYFLGDALPVAQETHVTPANPGYGDTFTLTINRKAISVIAGVSPTVADIVSAFVVAIAAAEIPEWQEVTADAGLDGGGNTTYLKLTGKADGTPFTVTATTTNVSGSAFAILVTRLKAGVAAKNSAQRVYLPGPPTGGNFTLTFEGQTTGNIAYNASAATVTTAIEALSTIGAGNTTVTADNVNGTWIIEFTGASFAGKYQPTFTATNVSLTGAGSVAVEMTQVGRPAAYIAGPVYKVTLEPGLISSWRFKFTGGSAFDGTPYYSPWIPAGAYAYQVAQALEAITCPYSLRGTGDVGRPANVPDTHPYDAVNVDGPSGGPWTIYVRTSYPTARDNDDAIEIDSTTYSAPGVVGDSSNITFDLVATHGTYNAAQSCIQLVVVKNAGGGTFTLTFEGQTTAATAYNALAATLQTNLQALSTIGASNATVTGTAPTYTVTFAAALASKDVPLMTANAASLTVPNTNVEIVQQGAAQVNELQEVAITGATPTGGTFTLTLGGETTSGISYAANYATIQTALLALASRSAGDLIVRGGPFPSNVVEVEMLVPALIGNLITGSASSLTGTSSQTLTVASNTVSPTGPHHWDNANNWSGAALPVAADKVYLQNIKTDILYGLDALSAVTLAEIHFMASFTGKFGLKPFNDLGYYEYRQLSADIHSTKIFVGEGPGGGSPYININGGTVQEEMIVFDTGEPDDASIPALCWKGTHASNVLRIFKGKLGIGIFVGDLATVLTLQIGYATDQASDVEYMIGAGVTLTTLQVSGGDGRIDLQAANATTLTMTGGTLIVSGTANITNSTLYNGALLVWNSTGTSTVAMYGEAELDFSQDMRTKSFGTITVYSPDATVSDPFKVVSSLVIVFNCEVQISGHSIGNAITLTRS
jgi:hypothetical protein